MSGWYFHPDKCQAGAAVIAVKDPECSDSFACLGSGSFDVLLPSESSVTPRCLHSRFGVTVQKTGTGVKRSRSSFVL